MTESSEAAKAAAKQIHNYYVTFSSAKTALPSRNTPTVVIQRLLDEKDVENDAEIERLKQQLAIAKAGLEGGSIMVESYQKENNKLKQQLAEATNQEEGG